MPKEATTREVCAENIEQRISAIAQCLRNAQLTKRRLQAMQQYLLQLDLTRENDQAALIKFLRHTSIK